ncbi:MAG TPA: hypothetical protein VJ598_12220 [Albitalea sp.]|nr:hypothetical protein [Albitalea sp.]
MNLVDEGEATRTALVYSRRPTLDTIRFIHMVRAGKGRVMACMAATALLAVAAHWAVPATYTASASVLVGVRGATPTQHAALATHAGLVRSERVARRVVTELRLARDPQMAEAWQRAVAANGDPLDAMAAELLRDVDVQPAAADSNVLMIRAQAHEPEAAAKIANGFAAAYLESVAELRSPPMPPARSPEERLRGAQASLMAYRSIEKPAAPPVMARDMPEIDGATLWSEAVAPALPTRPGLALIVGAALALGAALGMLWLLCADALSPRVRDVRDLDALQLDHLVTLGHARLRGARSFLGGAAEWAAPRSSRSSFSAWMAK